MEWNLDGELYYDTFSIYEDIVKSLNIIDEVDELWNTVEGGPSLHGSSTVHGNTIYDTLLLYDLSVP